MFRHLAVFLLFYHILLFLIFAFSAIIVALFLFAVFVVAIDCVGLCICASRQQLNNRYLLLLLCYSE